MPRDEIEQVAQPQRRLRVVEAALPRRRFGSRSRQRSVDSSAQVKSSVNQPSCATPSTGFVVRRSANSGRSATSVVPEISFSCRTTAPRPREDDIRLDGIHAHRERQVVGRAGVLGAVPGAPR
jgi:hypothetical protein